MVPPVPRSAHAAERHLPIEELVEGCVGHRAAATRAVDDPVDLNENKISTRVMLAYPSGYGKAFKFN